MKNRVTVVFDMLDVVDVKHFWEVVKQSLPDFHPAEWRKGDLRYINEMYTAYAKFLASGVPDTNTDPAILVTTDGMHFWKAVNGMYGNNQDFFSASEIYLNRQALETDLGPTTAAPVSP